MIVSLLSSILLFQNCGTGELGRDEKMAQDTTYSLVVREWSKRLVKYPENTEYRHSRALDLMSDGQYEDALLDMNQVLEQEKSVDFYLSKAAILMELNRSVEAEEAMKAAVDYDPVNDEAHYTLGRLYLIVRKFPESKRHLSEAIRLNNSNIDAYFNLGMVYKEDGDTSTAIQYFNRVIEIDALNEEAMHQIANLYSDQNDPKGLDYFNRIIFNNDLDHSAYYGRGFLYQKLGDYEKAMVDYQKAIDLRSSYYPAFYNAGYILYLQQNWERAIEHFRLAVKFAPDLARGYYMIGLCNELRENKEQALKFYNMTLQVDPDFAKAKERLQTLNNE